MAKSALGQILLQRLEHAGMVWDLMTSDGSGDLIAQDTPSRKRVRELEAETRVGRALRALSQCNKAVVHASDELELMREVCRIVVEDAGYRLALVAMAAQDEAWSVRPVAHWGYEDGYLDTLGTRWEDAKRGWGPAGRAILTGKSAHARDIATDPSFGLWRAEATKRGYASCLAVPLTRQQEPFGALLVFASEPGAFDSGETALLEDLAQNLSYGLFALRNLEERGRAEQNLRQAKEEWEQTFDAVPDLVIILDDHHRIVRANKAMAERLGFTPEIIAGRTCFECVHGEDAPASWCPHSKLLADGNRHVAEVVEARMGGVFEVSVSPLHDADGRLCGSVHLAHDITDRKRSERALRESEERYRRLVENASDIVFRTDAHGFFTFANPATLKITGYPEEEVVGKHYLDFIHPEYRREAERFYGSQVAKAMPNTYYEYPLPTKGGETVWLGQNVQLLTDAGSVVGFQAIARDVTDRKKAEDALRKARDELEMRVMQRTTELSTVNERLEEEIRQRVAIEEALRKSEELHRTILTNISDAVFLTDDDGMLTFICPNVHVIFGYSYEEVKAFGNLSSLLGNDLVDFSLLRRQGEIRNIERTIQDKNGAEHVLLINAKLVSIGAGTVLYSCRDATELKRYHAQLDLAARVFENTNEAIVICDASHTILDVNDAFCRQSGYSREELLGKDARALKSGRHRPEFYREMWDELRSTGQWHGEIWDRRKNGEVYPQPLSINAVRNSQNEVTHYVGISTDVSHIKLTEARLEQLAHYDQLTGLANRVLFRDRLNQALG